MSIIFPKGFIFGAASAAAQIEGHSTADGGGLSVWDVYSHTPGMIDNGENGDTACDSYHRYAEDVALVRGLGADAYRFSASWARCDPEGGGSWNEAGFDETARGGGWVFGRRGNGYLGVWCSEPLVPHDDNLFG